MVEGGGGLGFLDEAPLALRFLKEGMRRASVRDAREFGSWVSGTLGRLFQTEDHREGVASFLEKPVPVGLSKPEFRFAA